MTGNLKKRKKLIIFFVYVMFDLCRVFISTYLFIFVYLVINYNYRISIKHKSPESLLSPKAFLL